MEKIAQGAEAIIYLEKKYKKPHIIKERISKTYRHPELDKKIIKRRTKAEEKIIKKLTKKINVPLIIDTKKSPLNSIKNNENKIKMQFIDGKKLSQTLEDFPLEKQKHIMKLVGELVSKLHAEDIVHGDLTTSNMIFVEKPNKKMYLIDFGLAYQNAKYENKGVDIHLLKQALEAKHFKNWKILFQEFEINYKRNYPKESEKVLQRLKSIEKRGRYRH